MEIKKLYNKRPVIIAGPCSAETEEQVLTIAHQLKDQKIDLFRAGIWKPRTRPNSFEGVGSVGLKWLRRVKEETGLKTTTEVANRTHVKELMITAPAPITIPSIIAAINRFTGSA